MVIYQKLKIILKYVSRTSVLTRVELNIHFKPKTYVVGIQYIPKEPKRIESCICVLKKTGACVSGWEGTLILSSNVGLDWASNVYPKEISGIEGIAKKYLKF